jgi:hypothetical protein
MSDLSSISLYEEGTTAVVPSTADRFSAVFQTIPPEAITRIVDVVADVIRASKIMEAQQQRFEHDLAMLREGNMDRKERLQLLAVLLREAGLSEALQDKLVESICKIAEGR